MCDSSRHLHLPEFMNVAILSCQKTLSQTSPPLLWLLNLSTPFVQWFLILEGRKYDGDAPLVAEYSIKNYSLHFEQVRVSSLTTSFHTKKLL